VILFNSREIAKVRSPKAHLQFDGKSYNLGNRSVPLKTFVFFVSFNAGFWSAKKQKSECLPN
jgi:hypothetical protein